MSIDPIDSFGGADTVNALREFGTDTAEISRFDDQTYSSNSVGEVLDYKISSDSNNALDFAQTGTNWDPHKNILASYFDGSGSIVNGYY